MAEQLPKRHHYVSKFLLRRFTDDQTNEKKGRLVRLDKTTGKPERTNVLNEAVIGHYYRFMRPAADGSLEPDVSVEKDLAERETAAAAHVRKLVEPGGRLDAQERRQFAEFVQLSRKRTPLARAWAEHQHGVMAAQWREVYNEEPTGLPDTPEERAVWMMYLALDVAAAAIDEQLTWTLLRAPARRPFVIGDTPVTVIDLETDRRFGVGLTSSPATKTTLPLDPSLCLLLTLGDEPWVERDATDEEVDDINLRSYAWAQHSIYGNSQAAVTTVRSNAKAKRQTLGSYAPRSGKLWIGEEIEGQDVWDGFSPTEAGVKPNVRR